MSDASPAVVLDRAELAWAAGFFDGEGSTIVHTDESRPGYLRLEVRCSAVRSRWRRARRPRPVPERRGRTCAELSVPKVVTCYKCVSRRSARGHGHRRASLESYSARSSVVRPNEAVKTFLSPVRSWPTSPRAPGVMQRRVFELRRPVQRRRGRTRSGSRPGVGRAVFMDGEGCFGIARAGKRVNGPDWYRVRASATQHGEPQRRHQRFSDGLQRLLGGRIERHGESR